MRNRKEGLMASNKEEYCQMCDEQEELFSKRKRRYQIPKKLNPDDSDDSDDQLGASSEYHLSPKQRTMTEDEEELTNKLHQINLESKNLQHHLASSDIESSKINISPTTKSTGSNNTDDQNYKEFFLNQNIINYDDLLKIIVIGETAVGKSLFISKITHPNIQQETSTYSPTKTFAISKTVINVNNRTLGLELWDTNVSIASSELIKTYYKLSHGFVLVIEYAKNEDCSFIKKQIEMIVSCTSNPNIFLIVNQHKESCDSSDLRYKTLNEQREALTDKYFISKMHCDLSRLNVNNKDFISFIWDIHTQKQNSKCKYDNVPKRVKTADYSMSYRKNETPNESPSFLIRSKLNELYDELQLGD